MCVGWGRGGVRGSYVVVVGRGLKDSITYPDLPITFV